MYFGEELCFGGSTQLSRPDSSHRMVLFFRGCSRRFMRCSVAPISSSLPPMPMPSFLCTCLRFRIRWRGSMTRSNTLETIYRPLPSLRLLRQMLSRGLCPDSHWFSWRHCVPSMGWFADLWSWWSKNRSGFHGCGAYWYSPTCESSIEA